MCGLSLVGNRGYSAAVLGLLLVVASLIAEHRLLGGQASVVETHRLSSGAQA